MSEWLTTYFEPDEAHAIADFLVEVIGLEAEIKATLCHYYARPERRADFERRFVEGVQLGRAVKHLQPVLEQFGHGGERHALDEVVRLRNLVVHRVPQAGYDDPEGGATGFVVWEQKNGGQVLIEDIGATTVEAARLSGLIRRLRVSATR